MVLVYTVDFRALASQARLAELNPYVTVEVSSHPLSLTSDLQFLCQFQVSHYTMYSSSATLSWELMDYHLFQCVVLTDADLELQKTVDNFCRTQSPPISVRDVSILLILLLLTFDLLTVYKLQCARCLLLSLL